jgi:hypothetical protein
MLDTRAHHHVATASISLFVIRLDQVVSISVPNPLVIDRGHKAYQNDSHGFSELPSHGCKNCKYPPSKAWRIALSFLQGMRRWLFLPCLVIVIPFLLVTTGTSSLQICFNTIAILFLADVDNLVYAFFLAERVRARLEDVGRVQLTADDLRPLQVTKIAHVVKSTWYQQSVIRTTMTTATSSRLLSVLYAESYCLRYIYS